MAPPDSISYAGVPGRSWKENKNRSEPPTLQVTVGVNNYSHFFSRINEKSTQNSPRSTPEAILMHNLLISLSQLHPPPAPWQRGCTPLTPTRGYTLVHITPITPENNNKNNSCQSSLLAATRPSNTHEGGGCSCCCGLGVDTDAPDAIGGQCARL